MAVPETPAEPEKDVSPVEEVAPSEAAAEAETHAEPEAEVAPEPEADESQGSDVMKILPLCLTFSIADLIPLFPCRCLGNAVQMKHTS